MNSEIENKLKELQEFATNSHYYCEDSWYSCPLAEDGCGNDALDKNTCYCGADEKNKEVRKIINELRELLK